MPHLQQLVSLRNKMVLICDDFKTTFVALFTEEQNTHFYKKLPHCFLDLYQLLAFVHLSTQEASDNCSLSKTTLPPCLEKIYMKLSTVSSAVLQRKKKL